MSTFVTRQRRFLAQPGGREFAGYFREQILPLLEMNAEVEFGQVHVVPFP